MVEGYFEQIKEVIQNMGIKQIISTIFTLWMITSFFRGQKQPQVQTDSKGNPLPPITPQFQIGEKLDLYVFINENETFEYEKSVDDLVLFKKGFRFKKGDISLRNISSDVNVTLSENVRINNSTIYSHIFIVKSGKPIDPSDKNFRQKFISYKKVSLVRFVPPPINKNTKNLISGKGDDEVNDESQNIHEEYKLQNEQKYEEMLDKYTLDNEEKVVEWKPHWFRNFTINMVEDTTSFSPNQMPQQFFDIINLDPNFRHYTLIYINDFWMMRKNLEPINETTLEMPLHIEFDLLQSWKFLLYFGVTTSFSMHKSMGTMIEEETEEFKRILIETNPWILGFTFIVSLLHMLFEFLAFKNEITFWNKRDSVEGLSVRTITLNAFSQVIIFLYLLDNDTSFMVLISNGFAILIEFWKIYKATNVTFLSRFPFIKLNDRDTYYKNKTNEYDSQAMKYLYWVLVPLIIGYSIYALVYEEHKGWYSWILSSLVGTIYTFGFIAMTPQLFINYKLKSVAHMNWKAMTYKTITTFIDDLFAWVIKMPTLHRIATLRDDIIFFIYLYQRRIYRIDKSRVNEFGQITEPKKQEKALKEKEKENDLKENDLKESKKEK
ncbi:cleft lip and palate transmembrane protein [Anaeramoeba ignava]|uniref:Cleft lip and palate transmembrane protein n=1 Tax=Anaeramoeba ignava TaxID=1746090 RepID=A0A9Q0LPU4_ANAIG|nr:cleft lip and palate transmembrane protein [Anaeramoeba ignava]